MGNVKFVYLYRDGANYKSWNEVVFTNPDRLDLEGIERSLIVAFLTDKLFIADQISVPDKFLFIEDQVTKFDHCYHEFDHVEICEEKPTDSLSRTVTSFLKDVKLASEQGWKAFDILEFEQRPG